jgi:hypothetical protein
LTIGHQERNGMKERSHSGGLSFADIGDCISG